MKQIIKQLGLVLGSASAVVVLTVAPVWAEHGVSAESSATGSGNVSSTPGTGVGSSETSDSKTSDEVTGLRKQAQQLLQTKRQDVKERTEAQKQAACKAHQAEVDMRTKSYAVAAQRHLGVFNKIFTQLQDFQKKKQLNVPNYDTLVATATAKQTAAQTAVDALKTLNVTLDCTQPDPASSVATLKTAVANARTALQDYRSAIKDIIVALKAASTSTISGTAPTTSTGSEQ